MQFDGKVVLITGASSGIGAATAKLFSELGASLVLSGRNFENLKKVSNECANVSKNSREPLIVVADLTNENDVASILQKTIQHFGKLDVLVNNAAIDSTCTIENTSLEEYDIIMNTNLRSIYQLTHLAVPHLISSKGTIVNVSSITGLRAFPEVVAYSVSKAALDQFTRCVALQLASKQVRCNGVNPGVILTDFQKKAGMSEKDYQKFLERSKEVHPLRRPGNAREVAKTIAFLAGDDSSFITGVSLPCDGGRHAMCPS